MYIEKCGEPRNLGCAIFKYCANSKMLSSKEYANTVPSLDRNIFEG